MLEYIILTGDFFVAGTVTRYSRWRLAAILDLGIYRIKFFFEVYKCEIHENFSNSGEKDHFWIQRIIKPIFFSMTLKKNEVKGLIRGKLV